MPGPLLTEPVAIFMTIMVVLLLAPLLSDLVRLPGIVGLILAGVLIGQHGLNLLTTTDTIELFGTVGLIYLMFNAGLEIDLQQFKANRYQALAFAAVSYLLPQALGLGIGRGAGIAWAGAALLGAAFASQTLVAQPLLSELGIVRNQAVAVTVGATVFTDITSLLVLAVAVSAGGDVSGLTALLQTAGISLAYALVILLGVPWLGRTFFRYFQGNTVEFQFVLAVLFVAALTAERIGMHPIVGAFLAGLAINRTLSKNSRVVGHLHFVGSSLFVPLFMVTIGMRIDPLAIVSDQRTWILGAALTAAVYLTKLAAAWGVGQWFGYSKDERVVMWGLSQAQAAATLATVLVGTNAGLLPDYVLDSAILTIMATVVTSPLLVSRFGKDLKVKPAAVDQDAFRRILVPITSEEPPTELIKLAALLANTSGGSLLLLNLAKNEGALEGRQPMADLAALEETSVEVESLRRIADPIEDGLTLELTESQVSMLLLPWEPEQASGRGLLDPMVATSMWESETPLLAVRLGQSLHSIERVTLVLAAETVGVKLSRSSVQVAKDVARALELPLQILTTRSYREAVQDIRVQWSPDLDLQVVELGDDLLQEVQANLGEADLVLLPAMGSRDRFIDSGAHLPARLLEAEVGSVAILRTG